MRPSRRGVFRRGALATSKLSGGGHLILASYCSVAPSPSVACSKVVATNSVRLLMGPAAG